MAAMTMLRNLRAQNDKREEENRYLREKMEQSSRDADARALGLAQLPAAKKRDILGALGTQMTEQGRASLNLAMDARDADAKAQESQAGANDAQSIMRQLLQFTGGNQSVIPQSVMDPLKLKMMQGGEASPESAIQQMVMLAQLQAASASQERERSFDDQMRLANEQSVTQEERTLRIDATKREREMRDTALAGQRAAALTLYGNAFKDALISENGLDPKAQDRILSEIQNDPVLGGENAEISMNTVIMNALSEVRGSQDAITAKRDMENRSGVRIPLRLAKMVVDGNAIEEPMTGLPFRMPKDKNAARIGMIQNAIDALARIETYGKRIASSGRIASHKLNPFGETLDPSTAEMRTSRFMRTVGMGTQDPDVNAYDAAREAFKLAYTYVVTGATTNEGQIKSIEAQLPKLSELERDPRTGGIRPGARRRLDGAYRNLLTQILQSSLMDASITETRFRSAYEEKIAEYTEQENADRSRESAPAQLLPSGSQTDPGRGVQIPGARIRTGP